MLAGMNHSSILAVSRIDESFLCRRVRHRRHATRHHPRSGTSLACAAKRKSGRENHAARFALAGQRNMPLSRRKICAAFLLSSPFTVIFNGSLQSWRKQGAQGGATE